MNDLTDGYHAPRILLVDDDPNFLSIMRVHLGSKGYLVMEAMDGRDGIELSVGDKPDLILMDIHMPRLDGLSAIDKIRHAALTHSIPIIAISNFYLASQREKAMELGCVACLDKCTILDSLESVMNQYLPVPEKGNLDETDLRR